MRRFVLIACLPCLLLCSCASSGSPWGKERKKSTTGGVSWGDIDPDQGGLVQFGFPASVDVVGNKTLCNGDPERSIQFSFPAMQPLGGPTKPKHIAQQMVDEWNNRPGHEDRCRARIAGEKEEIVDFDNCPDNPWIKFTESRDDRAYLDCVFEPGEELKGGIFGQYRPAKMVIKGTP